MATFLQQRDLARASQGAPRTYHKPLCSKHVRRRHLFMQGGKHGGTHKHVLGLTVCTIAMVMFVKSFQAGSLPDPPYVPRQYIPIGNCTGTRRHDPRNMESRGDRGKFLSDLGVREMDNHPLSTSLGMEDRLRVLGWVYSPPPDCLVEKIMSTVRTSNKQLIMIHSSLESDYFSLVLNLLLSLSRSHVSVDEILVVLYDYEPIPEAVLALLNAARIQYMSVWEFDLPNALFVEPKLTPPQFFFVRNVIHLKLLKMGYGILHLDSDLVVLRDHPFKSLNPDIYSIEAAPGASPKVQRMKWGHTLNCGYMSISSSPQTIRFVERLLAYNFDSDHPIDQWALNEVLDLAGARFKSHRLGSGSLVQFRNDKGPVVGHVGIQQDMLKLRILDPQEYLAGRWLNQHNKSNLTFQSFIESMSLNPKSVHISNVQKGVASKIESLKLKGLWFLQSHWEALALNGQVYDLSSLDNGIPTVGKRMKEEELVRT